jgi:serine/threonine-protein kinase RsbW
MASRKPVSVELKIPSTLGYEKVAMDLATSLARKVGLSPERIEDLRTAVSEACTNAIEHAHQQHERRKVVLLLSTTDSALEVSVRDHGLAFEVPEEAPDLTAVIEGEKRSRGWGLFLIRSLVDEVEFRPLPKGGNVVRMVIHIDDEPGNGEE